MLEIEAAEQKPKAKSQKSKVSKHFCFLAFGVWLLLCCPSGWGASPEETAETHYQTGLAYERLGRTEEAYTELQLACALDDNDGAFATALGVVACRLGRFAEAQRALEHSIVLDAGSIASYYHLALLYEKQGQWDRAMDSWHRFTQLNQNEELKLIARRHIENLQGSAVTPP